MKRNSREVVRLVNYAKQATPEQLMEDYEVEILEDGGVYDAIEDHVFASITEWAEDVIGFHEPDPNDYKRYAIADEE